MLDLSSRVIIKPHPRIIIAQAPQIMRRYPPVRVTAMPDTTAIKEEPRENGIILKNVRLK